MHCLIKRKRIILMPEHKKSWWRTKLIVDRDFTENKTKQKLKTIGKIEIKAKLYINFRNIN